MQRQDADLSLRFLRKQIAGESKRALPLRDFGESHGTFRWEFTHELFLYERSKCLCGTRSLQIPPLLRGRAKSLGPRPARAIDEV
jgi:hypothetical protein